ncbi:oxidoreductase domain protein [Methylorubrum populi BJ001]|uniref:Oxidoreductase domain protein n=1 Tax=Methylorubrum populi (strain ATCC BAA-705 / NCIMB 13946 / BJ001) TaxID=441620 RepID=B1Z7S3_METPB|nr:Gfo/Idh/MocA family oxidoreductase [Methylorubrum populi]ACB83147.1 oxidoreductase domain protein [Methylorubrum populi BJ001]OAH20843.1 oxidoreductase [Methylorubrum populi]PZP71128.1 MAG: gfo/Idh/MocA family oxidoreductase [Methylorubrum populi]
MHDPSKSRRLFLAGGAAGLGAAIAGGRAAAQADRGQIPTGPVGRPEPKLEEEPPLPLDRQLGWAVVGLGDYAQGYVLPALARARRSRAVALVSGNPEKAKRVAARYGVGENALYGYDTMGRLAGNDAVGVVYIVTANATHAELTVKAFEAGKHVFCEKPMANSPAECQRMIDAAKAAGRKLMIAYRAHWEPHNLRAKAILDSGALGQVWFASSDHHRPLDPSLPRDQWRMKRDVAGGGSLVDIGIYSLNGLQWFLGESPNAVAATMQAPPGDPRFAEVENVFSAELAFPSGRRATISSGYTASKKRIDLWGDRLVATLDPATAYQGNRLVVSNAKKAEEILTEETSAAQFTGEIDHFSQAVTEGTEVRTPGEMGLRDMRLIEALYRAARERRWLDLNPDMTVREA